MTERSIEDRLREEYFALLSDTRQIADELEAEVRYSLLPLSCSLRRYEKIEVTSRVKDCESALGALRRRQEGATFDTDRADSYTLTALNDLAGVRVLAFPRSRCVEAQSILRRHADFAKWTSDPVPSVDTASEPLAFKYYGYCSRSSRLRAELQIVPMLIGLFWQVEHSAIYKPTPELKGVLASLEMLQPMNDVYKALRAFEDEFERLVGRDPLK
jgi:hypothetical protein